MASGNKALWKCEGLYTGAIVIIKTNSFPILFSRLRPTVKLVQFKELQALVELQ